MRRYGGSGKSFSGMVGKNETICQLTSLIDNNQLLRPFIEPVLMNVNLDDYRPVFLEFLTTVFQFGSYFTVK